MRTPKQFNNVTERVIDDLKQSLSSNSQISIAAASFSIYAYEALKEELEKVDCVHFIFTSPTFNTDKTAKQKREFYIPKINRERNLFGSDFEIRLRNQLTQKAIARECADWIRRKAQFKSNVTHGYITPAKDAHPPICNFANSSTKKHETDGRWSTTAICSKLLSTASSM